MINISRGIPYNPLTGRQMTVINWTAPNREPRRMVAAVWPDLLQNQVPATALPFVGFIIDGMAQFGVAGPFSAATNKGPAQPLSPLGNRRSIVCTQIEVIVGNDAQPGYTGQQLSILALITDQAEVDASTDREAQEIAAGSGLPGADTMRVSRFMREFRTWDQTGSSQIQFADAAGNVLGGSFPAYTFASYTTLPPTAANIICTLGAVIMECRR